MFRAAAARGQLSMCATKYLMACTKASSPSADGACIPTFPALPSQKAKGFIRGTAVIGLGGVGFVAVSPCVGSDYQCVTFSNSSFSGQAVSDTSNPEVVAQGLVNLPYAGTAVGSVTNGTRVNGRIVGGELCVQYTGTALNRSGMIYAYTDPNHTDVNGMTAATLGARQQCRVVVNRGQRVGTALCAVRPEEVEYPPYSAEISGVNNLKSRLYPYSDWNNSGSAAVGSLISCILFTGVPGESFQFEYHQHVEYCGGGTAGRTTPTDLDSTGFEAVNTAVNAAVSGDTSEPFASAANWLNQHGHTVGKVAAGMSSMYAGFVGMPNSFQALGA